MDEIDTALVLELQRDARQAVRDLAREVGIPTSTCFERIKRLHARGVLTGYHAEVDAEALGRSVQAMVFAQVRPLSRDLIDTFQRDATQMPEVMAVFVLAGGDDFLLHVGVPSVEALHAFLVDSLSARREVVNFRSSIVFQHQRVAALTSLADQQG